MSLNPNAPTIVGSEWFPRFQRGWTVGRDQQVAIKVTPDATHTADDVIVYVASRVGSPLVRVDIVPWASILPTVTTTSYRPNEDVTVADLHSSFGGGSPFYSRIDEAVLDLGDSIRDDALTGEAVFRVGSAGFTGRPLSLAVVLVCDLLTGAGSVNVKLVDTAAASHTGPITTISTDQTTVSYTWTTNPQTGVAWTAADIVALDSSWGGIGVDWTVDILQAFRGYQLYVDVVSVPEDRVATGTFSPTANGHHTVPMATIAAGDTFSLVNGTAYGILFSVPSGDGSIVLGGADSGELHPAGYTTYPVAFVDGVPTTLGAEDTGVPMFAFVNTSGVALFGQPTAEVGEVEVHAGQTVTQEVTLPDTDPRGWFSFVARRASIDTTADLLVKLKRRSDGTQIGGTLTVTTHDIRDEPDEPQVLALPAASGGAGTAAQHYVEFTSTAAEGEGWNLTYVDTAEGGLGEQLTPNQQSLEVNTTGWAAGTSASLSRSTAQAHAGTASLRMENAGVSAARLANTPTGLSGLPVVAGDRILVSGWFRQDESAGTGNKLAVNWYNAAGAATTSEPIGAPAGITLSTTWQELTEVVTAPADGFASLLWEVTIPSTQHAFADDFKFTNYGQLAVLTAGAGLDVVTIGGVDDVDREIPVLVGVAHAAPANLAVTEP